MPETDAADILEIQQLQSRYCHLLADGDLDGLCALFTTEEHAEVDLGGVGRFVGADGPRRAFSYLLRDRGIPGVFQFVTAVNPLIEFSPEGDRARGGWISEGAESQLGDDGALEDRWRYGRFAGELVRSADGWRFVTLRWHLSFTARGDWSELWQLNMVPFPTNPPPHDLPTTYHRPFRPDEVVRFGAGAEPFEEGR